MVVGPLCKTCDDPEPEFYEKAGRTCKKCCVKRTMDSHARNKATRTKYAKAYYASDKYKATWKERKLAKRSWIKEQKDAPCVDCDHKFPPECMDFDHLDRAKKSFNIAAAISSTRTIASIRMEIRKCDLVCANCHRIRTARQMGWL